MVPFNLPDPLLPSPELLAASLVAEAISERGGALRNTFK